MLYSDSQLHRDQPLEQQAMRVALLAFRCARHDDSKRGIACKIALNAYLDIVPDDDKASDRVIKAIATGIEHHPHWLA